MAQNSNIQTSQKNFSYLKPKSYKQKLENNLQIVEARHRTQIRVVDIEKDDLLLKDEQVDSEIQAQITKIKNGRRNELKILEECDRLTAQIQSLSNQSAALYIILSRNDPFLEDNAELIHKAIGEEYDKTLSDLLRQNIELKEDLATMEDYVELLKVYQVNTPKGSFYRDKGVNSEIEDISFVSGDG
jgi:hypothetical protein